MPDRQSITHWLEQLKDGNPQAEHELCERCWRLVVHQARQRLQMKIVVSDEEDVAISVFDTFFRRVKEGEYAAVEDGNDLRVLFLAITKKKALEDLRNENRLKRGGGVVKMPIFDDLASSRQNPALEAEWNDQCHSLFQTLDEGLREVTLLRLDGMKNNEIAQKLSMPLRAVERKLALTRELWTKLRDSDESKKE